MIDKSLRVLNVKYIDEYKLKVKFSDGNTKLIDLKEYLETYGNKKLFLPKDYEFEDDELSLIEKYSIVEKTKEYQLIEIYSESSDWDITSKYKVFYDGKVILTYSFDKACFRFGSYYESTFYNRHTKCYTRRHGICQRNQFKNQIDLHGMQKR